MTEEKKNTKENNLHPLTSRFREIKRKNIEQSKKDKEEFLKEKSSREKQPEKKIAQPRTPEVDL